MGPSCNGDNNAVLWLGAYLWFHCWALDGPNVNRAADWWQRSGCGNRGSTQFCLACGFASVACQ
eukprot:10569334-Ditylum_brightwellii.AAC.1